MDIGPGRRPRHVELCRLVAPLATRALEQSMGAATLSVSFLSEPHPILQRDGAARPHRSVSILVASCSLEFFPPRACLLCHALDAGGKAQRLGYSA